MRAASVSAVSTVFTLDLRMESDTRQERIALALEQGLSLQHLDVANESHNHNVPQGAESHFKVVCVAEDFAALSRIDRHRAINGLVADEFDAGMHALAVHAYTPAEWEKRFGDAPMSPPCAHQKDST